MEDNFNGNFSNLIGFKNKELYIPSERLSLDEDWVALYNKLSFNMKFYEGIGLAAIQLGVLKTVFVFTNAKGEIELAANPEIIEYSDDLAMMTEGCLSFPGAQTVIARPSSVKVRYQNVNKEPVEKELTGRDARVFQHEIQHNFGKTMLDSISYLKKTKLLKTSAKFMSNPQFGVFFK